jgi:hypothetical protein
MFRSLQFSLFKDDSATVTMTKFLTELETKLRRLRESEAQRATAATALAFQRSANPPNPPQRTPQPNNPPGSKKPRPFCSNGTHNPECTGHAPSKCNQLNPARGLAYHQGKIDKLNAPASKKALLSVNSGVANSIVLNSGASGHYLKCRNYFTSFRRTTSSVYGANGASIPILGTVLAIIYASTGPIFIKEAYYAPALSNSLIPMTYYVRRGYAVTPT